MIPSQSRRSFILGGIGAAGFSALSLDARARSSAAQFDELARLIQALMQDNVVPGASIAVVQDARVSWHREFGVSDAGSRRRVDEDSVFEAASVSKSVFAYAVMQLCDRNMLALDTPLTNYTTDRILSGDPRLAAITARHVLSHTSGLPNFRSRAEPLSIQFAPGQKYRYSGEGYWYLQSVMTRLAGRVDPGSCGSYEAGLTVCATDIATYLKANVLVPCGMARSTYVWNDHLEQHMVRSHDPAGKPIPQSKTTAVDAARYAAMGGLRTTAIEYAGYLTEILSPRGAPAFRLAPDTRHEMLRPQITVDATHSWALGWEIRHTPQGDLFQHQGGQRGVQAFAAASLERRSGYIIMTNSDNGARVFYDARFIAAMDKILLGK
ncbi:MAG: serine hydrolase domain-containing protein [Gemmatimonas sp.]